MNRPVFKRICAYIIDTAVVSFILFLFAKVEILNPNLDEINKVQADYEKYVETLTKENADVSRLLDDEKIQNYGYELAKLQIPVSIVSVVITFGYFVVFQYFNKGQTIGKKFMKIKVKSVKSDKPTFTQILVRSLLINEIIISILSIIFLDKFNQANYYSARRILELIDMIFVYGSLGFIMFRSDGRGIHDLLAHTCVVSEDEVNVDTVNDNVVIEETNNKEHKVSKVKDAKVVDKNDTKNNKESNNKNVKKDVNKEK